VIENYFLNHARICTWNQPVLSNEGKDYCSNKQREVCRDSNSFSSSFKIT